eukprot:4371417-Pleurochrysis_carterae.AAC.2
MAHPGGYNISILVPYNPPRSEVPEATHTTRPTLQRLKLILSRLCRGGRGGTVARVALALNAQRVAARRRLWIVAVLLEAVALNAFALVLGGCLVDGDNLVRRRALRAAMADERVAHAAVLLRAAL